MSERNLIADEILEHLDALVYLVDMENYELLYINDYGKQMLGIENCEGELCYRALQGKDAPCEFCTNHLLTRDAFYIWERTHPLTGRYYLLKDKLVEWRGKAARLEVAIDITEKENTSRDIKNNLAMQRALVDCVRTFYTAPAFNEAIDAILSILGRIHQADRAYVFEYVADKQGQVIANNTHEWCAEGIDPQKDKLQAISMDVLPDWNKFFSHRQSVAIPDLEEIRISHPYTYGILKGQQITNLMIAQLNVDGTATGFIGVDNPRHMEEDLSLLWSLTYFMAMEQEKRRMESHILHLSRYDSLTGLCNRHSYMLLLKELDADVAEAGVAFIDLNALKKINDCDGHEAGDLFIKSMSDVFIRHFRKDEAFRIGGDEFVIICRNIPEALFHKKIRELRREAEKLHPGALALGSVWQKQGGRIAATIARADQAMYADKKRHYARRG